MRNERWVLGCVCALVLLSSVEAHAQNTWSAVAGGKPIAYCQNAWAPTRDVVWVNGSIGDAGGLYVSTNGGVSFETRTPSKINLPLDTVVLDANRAIVMSADSAAGDLPYASYTADGGKTWTRKGTISQKLSYRGTLFTQDGQHLLALV
jgi:hypothetical protein